MRQFLTIGTSVPRQEASEKVTGIAKYTNDIHTSGMLHVKMVTSSCAHGTILSIDTSKARKAPGVRAVITGQDVPILTGSPLADRPPIAVDKVRYHGEPVAVVVADEEYQAMNAAKLVDVAYHPLPVVNSPTEAIQSQAPLVHENLASYKRFEAVYPVPGTNIANHVKIRKGDIQKGWAESDVTIEASFSIPQSDHAAMETRCAMAEIKPNGRVEIYSASQSPYVIRDMLSLFFSIDPSQIVVHTPLVGGAFGGKAPVQLEFIAYVASKAVGGRKVKLVNSREEDFITSPVHIGLDAKVKLGATKQGNIVAAKITYLFDGGAYSDRAAIITRAAAQDCTGPYRIDNVHCDSFCMYTNHPYATSFRGFGHPELTFVIERAMDILAARLNLDPLTLRRQIAIGPGDTTPTQTVLTTSNVGNLAQCIDTLKQIIRWDDEPQVVVEGHKVRSKGVSCFWKNSSTPTDAGAGAVLLLNRDGSARLVCGAVEIGQGTKTIVGQIVAERMKMNVDQVYVEMEVNTDTCPEHWKTVASRSTLLVGRAVLAAADDAIRQLRHIASVVLGSSADQLEIGFGRVYQKDNPQIGLRISDIAHGYRLPNGNTIGSQVIGRGSYTMRDLTSLDPETGKGNPGPEWGVGAQAVEIEFDAKDLTYRVVRAAAVIDAGKVMNPKAARGQMTGGMSMGLSFASREAFLFNKAGIIQNPQFRTYKDHRYGDQPEYLVEFVETPHLEAPYGLRGIGEHGVIGMPAALANSLSLATGIALNRLPLTPETIWRDKKENTSDSFRF
jgi:CO/xanthine dehydrogenase Mo-binding subunit